MTQEKILNECTPSQNDIDKRILFEMTGVKLDSNDYEDESSFEGDLSVLVSNLIGYSFTEDNDPTVAAALASSSPTAKIDSQETPLLMAR